MMSLKEFLILVCVFVGMVYYQMSHTVHYTMTGTCEEKIISQNRDGNILKYIILVKLEDGKVIEKEVEPVAYVSYVKGHTYVFSFSKVNW